MFFRFEEDTLSYVKIEGKASGVYRHIKLGARETGDSLRAERDTSLTYVPFEKKAERVEYAGDTIEYYAREREMALSENAKVDYQGKTLLGKHITYSANLELLDARGSPVLVEGMDKLHGDRMTTTSNRERVSSGAARPSSWTATTTARPSPRSGTTCSRCGTPRTRPAICGSPTTTSPATE